MSNNFLTKAEISKVIDIADPFLMIEKAFNYDAGKKIDGIQTIKSDSWFLKSHFVHMPTTPATLLVEGMLQTMVLLIYKSVCHDGEYSYINNINAKFIKPVRSQSEILHAAELITFKRGIFKGFINSFDEGDMIASCEVIYASPSLYYKK